MAYTIGDAIEVFGADILGSLGFPPGAYQEIVRGDAGDDVYVGVDRSSGGRGPDLMGAAEVLSALKAGGPGYSAIQRRAALTRPALRGRPLTNMNDVQVPVVVFGTTGQTPTATIQLMQHFKPEKLVVIEQLNNNTVNNPAQFQVLTGAFVGAQNMFPTAPGIGSGIHCGAFGGNAQGNAIAWATAKPAIVISLQVNFLSTGTFWGTLYGRTVS